MNATNAMLAADLAKRYGSKSDVHRELKVSYNRIAMAIREEKLAVYLIDHRLMIDIDEAKILFRK